MALNFNEFQQVVETAQQAEAVKADLKRTLKKVTGALDNLRAALGEMESVLAEDYVPAGRKPRKVRAAQASAEGASAGAPKKPGRPKKTAE